MFKIVNESFTTHISISCSSQCLTISIYEKYGLLETKQLHHLFYVAVYSNRLLNYNFQFEQYSIVNTLNNVLSNIKHAGSMDANDLTVHELSFLVLFCFDGKFLNKQYLYRFALFCVSNSSIVQSSKYQLFITNVIKLTINTTHITQAVSTDTSRII